MASVKSDGSNLIIPEGKGARLEVIDPIMRVGGKTPFTVASRKLQCGVGGSMGIH
jgi:hypothetical protein